MRFSVPTKFLAAKSLNKFAGVAAALIVLPLTISCSTGAETDIDADVNSQVPTDSSAEDVTGTYGSSPATDMPDATMPTGVDTAATGDSIVDVAVANGSFDTLVSAVQAADLEETLSSDGPFTVFAPTDEAFSALPEGLVQKLVKPENQKALGQILAYHVVPGTVASTDITAGSISTVEGSDVEVAVDATGVMINGEASVVQPDVIADNGVIHVIDSVLLPPTFDPTALM